MNAKLAGMAQIAMSYVNSGKPGLFEEVMLALALLRSKVIWYSVTILSSR